MSFPNSKLWTAQESKVRTSSMIITTYAISELWTTRESEVRTSSMIITTYNISELRTAWKSEVINSSTIITTYAISELRTPNSSGIRSQNLIMTTHALSKLRTPNNSGIGSHGSEIKLFLGDHLCFFRFAETQTFTLKFIHSKFTDRTTLVDQEAQSNDCRSSGFKIFTRSISISPAGLPTVGSAMESLQLSLQSQLCYLQDHTPRSLRGTIDEIQRVHKPY